MSGAPREYLVGFGKPPVHTRFSKGRSGNPNGRPKTLHDPGRLVQRVLDERIVVLEKGQRRRITKFEVAVKQLINKAASGEHRAIREVLRLRLGATTPYSARPEVSVDEQLAALSDRELSALIALLREEIGDNESTGRTGDAASPERV
jgi:hypothetical protein